MKKYFRFDENQTSYRREILGGLTTFLSMAYILAVNPQILSLAVLKGYLMHLKWTKVPCSLRQHLLHLSAVYLWA